MPAALSIPSVTFNIDCLLTGRLRSCLVAEGEENARETTASSGVRLYQNGR